jgi:excisionase family DNA binding protein
MPKTKETDIIEINEMKLYSVKALCDILKIHPLTIRTHIKKGKLKARQIGRRYYVTDNNLKEWLSQHAPKGK